MSHQQTTMPRRDHLDLLEHALVAETVTVVTCSTPGCERWEHVNAIPTLTPEETVRFITHWSPASRRWAVEEHEGDTMPVLYCPEHKEST